MIHPATIYNAYPGSDLLPIEPPNDGETMRQFAERAKEAADTLFLFICRELGEEDIDTAEAVRRLESAIADLEAVREAIQPPAPADEPLHTFQFSLGDDYPDGVVWINAHKERHAVDYANYLGCGPEDGWALDALQTTRASDDGVDVTLDRHGKPTHPIVTVLGGVAEEFSSGRGPSVSIIDFDNLKDSP